MPAVTFGGIGSGIDVESIISGLVGASRAPLNRVTDQKNQVQAAVSSMSDIGSLLSKLKTAVGSLDTIAEVGSFKTTSSNEAIAATAEGNAAAGSFQIEVSKLATSFKSYSNSLTATAGTALGQAGTLGLSTAGKSANVPILATDTLDDVVRKVNSSGLRVSASSLFDGTTFRMQLRGLDTGLANEVTVAEGGTTFGFTANALTHGANAVLTVDGFPVSSASNRVTGVIGGVTLALAKTTTAPVTLSVESDPKSLQDKLQGFVEAYNGVINKIHTVAGFSSIKAANQTLAGNAALRGITNRLSSVLTGKVGNGKFQTLRSIGVELRNDGTLNLSAEKLASALKEDSAAVGKILGGDDSTEMGAMDLLASLATDMVGPKGLIQASKDGLDARARNLTSRQEVEQTRLDHMQELLRKQFNEMDQAVSRSKAQLSFLGG